MLHELMQHYAQQVIGLEHLLLIINALLHLIFAGAVAKDAGKLLQIGQKPVLVSASTWAFAVLIGGVVTAAIYWFIHHSTLTRPGALSVQRERNSPI